MLVSVITTLEQCNEQNSDGCIIVDFCACPAPHRRGAHGLPQENALWRDATPRFRWHQYFYLLVLSYYLSPANIRKSIGSRLCLGICGQYVHQWYGPLRSDGSPAGIFPWRRYRYAVVLNRYLSYDSAWLILFEQASFAVLEQ